jgi:hypothetical protein
MAGFWKSYPLSLVLESKFNMNIFLPQEFERAWPSLSSEYAYTIISGREHIASQKITKIRQFIKTHFGSPPTTPILDIPEEHLLPIEDYIILITGPCSQDIIGCIRYHYLGQFITFNSKPIYCVDCFCIHPDFRKKSLGDFLLTTLHCFVNANKIPYSLFLKEGKSLSIVHTPLYSGTYVYRKLTTPIEPTHNVTPLSPQVAFNMIDIFQEFTPDLFIIRNIHSQNQTWLLYKYATNIVLACFQDTFQWFLDETHTKNRIVWCTAWFESPGLTDNCRAEAAKQLSDFFAPKFEYIWMNKVWSVIDNNSSIWKEDGHFHWYTYQWCSASHITRSYCIMT